MSKKLHDCKTPDECEKRESGETAIMGCYERDTGEFYVMGGEGQNQVNYCPFCGQKAPIAIGATISTN